MLILVFLIDISLKVFLMSFYSVSLHWLFLHLSCLFIIFPTGYILSYFSFHFHFCDFYSLFMTVLCWFMTTFCCLLAIFFWVIVFWLCFLPSWVWIALLKMCKCSRKWCIKFIVFKTLQPCFYIRQDRSKPWEPSCFSPMVPSAVRGSQLACHVCTLMAWLMGNT